MQLINTGPEPFFEDVVNHMASICHVPLAIVAVRDPDRCWMNTPDAERGAELSPEIATHLRALASAPAEGESLAAELAQARLLAYRSHISQPLVLGGREVGYLHLADTAERTWGIFETGYMARAARLVASHFEARAALAEREARIELERQLAEAGELHRAVIGSMAEGVIIQSADSTIIASNGAASAILGLIGTPLEGYKVTDFAGQVCNRAGEMLNPGEFPAIKAMRTGMAQFGLIGVQRPSGERRWLEVSAIPLSAERGATAWPVAVTFSDVTETERRMEQLQAARAEAEAANRAKSAFLANMSHEIRTPLNGVMGMAQVLRATNLDVAQGEFVQTILDSSQTLMTLLNDVLDLSKIEAGKFDIVPADTDLEGLLRGLHALWSPRASEKGLDLRLMLDAEAPGRMEFDGVRVQQCLSNYISNAIKFTARGEVSIRVRVVRQRDGYQVKIDVADTGGGIDPETLSRLFSPFVQADETISRRHGGTGLGLSITRKLAELMGGDATAHSVPGNGSVFTLTFHAGAVTSVPDAAAEEADAVGTCLHAPRILLVDDHPVNRQVARLFLRPLEADITEAVNGEEALARLEQDVFDVVLLDIHMPVLDGPSTIRRIRESGKPYARVPVIALTADAMSGDRERYLALGMDGYVSKPLVEPELLHALELTLRRPRLRTAA